MTADAIDFRTIGDDMQAVIVTLAAGGPLGEKRGEGSVLGALGDLLDGDSR